LPSGAVITFAQNSLLFLRFLFQYRIGQCREEWERRGEEVTAQMIERIKGKMIVPQVNPVVNDSLVKLKSNYEQSHNLLSHESTSSYSSDDSSSFDSDHPEDATHRLEV
jgi:hypothetical protein